MWTHSDIQALTEQYPLIGTACAAQLNRTKGAVAQKAKRLGLTAPGSKKLSDQDYIIKLLDKEILYKPIESYINSKTPITHTCSLGHEWKAAPSNILAGWGCPKCSGKHQYTSEEYKDKSPFKVLEDYVRSDYPILHECAEGHQWKVRPSDIINHNRGCPVCAKSGFNPDKPAMIYYIKIQHENLTYYKIGITNLTIAKRFEKDKTKKITTIYTELYDNGSEARIVEKELLDFYKKDRVTINNFLKSGGNSELFEYDILGLDS